MNAALERLARRSALRRVLVIGDVMTDIVVRPTGPLVRGSDRRATIRSVPGGSGANQAVWLASLGVETTFVGRVGAADVSRIEAHLRSFGVEPVLAADPTRPSGTLVSLIDPDGERSFLTDRGANDGLQRADLPDSLLAGLGLLHVSGYALIAPGPRAAVLDLLERARARDVAVTVDPSSTAFLEEVGPQCFLAWTGGAALCFPNHAEAATLTGSDDPVRQRAVLGRHYEACVIKRGAGGAEFSSGGRLFISPAAAVDCVDATGAGDAFLAGFLAALLKGEPPETCLERANIVGAQATTRIGGQPKADDAPLDRGTAHVPPRRHPVLPK